MMWPSLQSQRLGIVLHIRFLLVATIFPCAFVSAALSQQLVGWGNNRYGQISPPPNLSNIAAIAAGGNHSMALRSNGTVVAWGNGNNTSNYSDYGQSIVPVGMSNVTAIAAGSYHSMALLSNGTVRAWGDYRYGQTNVPLDLSNVIAIAAGNNHSLALLSNGTVRAWGSGSSTIVPSGLSGVRAIAAGVNSMALSNGTVVTWPSSETNILSGLTNVRAIAAGYVHSMALRSNGTVVAWGNNVFGETNVPAGLNGVQAIAAGYFHSVALRTNGTVIAWGSNTSGETNVPFGLSNVVAIAAGGDHTLSVTYSSPARPTNDNFADALVISGSTATVTGSNTNASKEAGEPDHAYNGGSASVWWSWTAPSHGIVSINTSGSSFIPLLAVYTGSNVSALNLRANSSGYSGSLGWISNLVVIAGTKYFIAVDGANGILGSISLSLFLGPPLPPPNDLFTNRISIPQQGGIVNGTSVGATFEPNEPALLFDHSLATIWWTWKSPANGRAQLVNTLSGTDTLLSVFTGNSVSNLSPVKAGLNVVDSFGVTSNTTYQIQADGYNRGVGNVSVLLSFCPEPQVQPPYVVSQSVEPGGIRMRFCADVIATPPVSYLWTVIAPKDYNYINYPRTNPCFEAVVSPTYDDFVNVQIQVTDCGGTNSQSDSGISCAICLSRGAPSLLSGTSGSGIGPTLTDAPPTNNCGAVSSTARWYKMIPSENGPVTFSTEGSTNLNTLLAVYTGLLSSTNSLVRIACSDNVSSSNLQSRVSFNAVTNTVYWIAVDPRTNNAPALRLSSGFEPRVAGFGFLPDKSFYLTSSLAPPMPFRVQAATTLTTNPADWSTVLTTNLGTNFPYLYYRDTSATNAPLRFYRLAPGP